MSTHSSILAWKIPWTEEPGGLQSIESQSWTQLSNWAHTLVLYHTYIWNFNICYEMELKIFSEHIDKNNFKWNIIGWKIFFLGQFLLDIVDLQFCISLSDTTKWISYIYMCMCVYMCIYKFVSIVFQVLSPYRLLQNIEQSSLL